MTQESTDYSFAKLAASIYSASDGVVSIYTAAVAKEPLLSLVSIPAFYVSAEFANSLCGREPLYKQAAKGIKKRIIGVRKRF
jgi:hypothetical protein